MNLGRILVTGGLGFLGSNFVRRVYAKGLASGITVLDNLSYSASLSNLPQSEFDYRLVIADIRDPDQVLDAVRGHDLVVHFAAETHNDNSLVRPRDFLEVNVLGTHNVAFSCLRQEIRMHHVSTDEVFGDLPLDESPGFDLRTKYNPSSPYSASKAASDHLVRSYMRSFGLEVTISNCSNNFGPFQHHEKFIPHSVKRIVSGQKIGIYGSGANVRDWIYVDDHSDGIISIAQKGRAGETYLFGGGVQLSNLDLAKRILRALNAGPGELEFIEDRVGHDLRYEINFSSTTERLGWVPNRGDFEMNLKKTVEFYRNLYLREKENL